ncbi:hypothetical protein NG744_10315 [Aliarcobacter cryaerophilus]|uniref:hypothetical protein n=1 Tax=Aliarcobacter cryaerophilus TaxID=28198 RepID=UPI003DA56481
MINSLNFHGIIGKIFDVEVFKGFMHIKYLEYFSTEAYFQRNIDREHIKNIIDFIDNDNKEFKIFPEIVIMLPEDIKSAEVHIRRNVVKSFGGELSQIQFKNLDKLKKEKLCKIIDGNHRVKAFLKSESYQKHIASDADAQVAISFINTKRGEIEAKAFFYYLNSKSKRLMSGDFFNYLEDKSSAPDDLKKIDKELYYFKKTYDEIKKVINGKFEEEEVAIRDGILKIAQEFAKSKHEQEYFDLILKGLIQTIPEIERIFKTANEFIIMLYIGMRIYLQEILNHKTQFKKFLEPINESEAIQTIVHNENENIQKSNTDIILITIEKIKKEIHGLKEWSYKAKIDFKNKDDENFEQIEFFYKAYNIYKNTFTPSSKKIFIAMPFHKQTEATYFLIKDVVNELNKDGNFIFNDLEVIRLDKEDYPTSQFINDRIMTEISECDLMIADLTGHNRNVYYEVGYKAGIDKKEKRKRIIVINDTSSIYHDDCRKEEGQKELCLQNHIEDKFGENKENQKINVEIKELNSLQTAFDIYSLAQIRFKDYGYLKTHLQASLRKFYTEYEK